jgi:hypothetical protein
MRKRPKSGGPGAPDAREQVDEDTVEDLELDASNPDAEQVIGGRLPSPPSSPTPIPYPNPSRQSG